MTPRVQGTRVPAGGGGLPVYVLLPLVLCLGCASLRASADANLQSGPDPLVGMSVGAAYNSASILLRRPWWEQLTGTVLLAGAGRCTPIFGRRMEGWHYEVGFGSGLVQWVNLMLCRRNHRGECHR